MNVSPDIEVSYRRVTIHRVVEVRTDTWKPCEAKEVRIRRRKYLVIPEERVYIVHVSSDGKIAIKVLT
ncbi:MAG: hypothetical protein DRJ40_09550 [Thermoprotei archaeon]|nr:MAG: hypothetical protein DRJ40_09550 [Thermoprotei archaeon]